MGRNTLRTPRGVIAALLCCLAALSVATGCGKKLSYDAVAIHGSVSLDGQPLQNGSITYLSSEPSKGSGGSAKVDAGKYELRDVPVGSVGFTFSASRETGKSITGPGGQPEPERINPIPMKYRSEGIVRDIAEGGQVDFELTSH